VHSQGCTVLCVHLAVPGVRPSAGLWGCVSVCLCRAVCPSGCVSICPSRAVCLSVRAGLCVGLSVQGCVSISLCRAVCRSGGAGLCVGLSVRGCVSVWLCVGLSVPPVLDPSWVHLPGCSHPSGRGSSGDSSAGTSPPRQTRDLSAHVRCPWIPHGGGSAADYRCGDAGLLLPEVDLSVRQGPGWLLV
uniref:Uncharacterized protein n=1 Tax=Zonotrichia albicollis TaxID=44394 RepID=A0A8D2QG38_ZONAL